MGPTPKYMAMLECRINMGVTDLTMVCLNIVAGI